MALTVKVKPRALREVFAAAEWWRLNRPAAPGAVAADLRAALQLLAEFPGIGAKVEGARDPETQRWSLDRIHHHIDYRPRGRHLEVIAFWGSERERGPNVQRDDPQPACGADLLPMTAAALFKLLLLLLFIPLAFGLAWLARHRLPRGCQVRPVLERHSVERVGGCLLLATYAFASSGVQWTSTCG